MTREEAIKSMYQYKATEDDQTVVPHTFELIDNWYIEGWDSIEKLEAIFNVEDLYDMDIDLKIYPKNHLELYV
jgi:acyl carrier protein